MRTPSEGSGRRGRREGSRTRRRPWVAALVAATLLLPDAAASAHPSLGGGAPDTATESATPSPSGPWIWPIVTAALVASFAAPEHEYAAGHRGIDLRSATADAVVVAPAAGVVAFAGQVAGRGVVTIDHGGGLVSTFEPILASVSAGDAVVPGARLGSISAGGHAAAGTLHMGLRAHGAYVNPLLMLGGVPRAVLLPCC